MSDANSEMIGKIKKLLALAEKNPNQAEREAAFGKAQQLMLKHRIEQSQLHKDTDEDFAFEGEAFRVPAWRTNKRRYLGRLIGLAADVFFLSLDLGQGRWGVTFIGRRESVAFAETLWGWLNKEFERQWKIFLAAEIKARRKNTTAKRDEFYLGITVGLIMKIKAQRSQFEQENALVLISESEKAKELYGANHNLSKSLTKKFNRNQSAFGGGIEASKGIHLNKQVDSPKGTKRLMIESKEG